MLARAKNTSIDSLVERGALSASKGVVRLLGRDELREIPEPGFCWLFTQQLVRAMETGGIEACAKMLSGCLGNCSENAKALAYRLFTIADRKVWSSESLAYNTLVISWPEIQDRAEQLAAAPADQLSFEV